jgi:hypothetical protein
MSTVIERPKTNQSLHVGEMYRKLFQNDLFVIILSMIFFLQKTYEKAMSQPQPSYRKPGTPTMIVRNKPPSMLQVQY